MRLANIWKLAIITAILTFSLDALAAPSITSISPAAGPVGTIVTITGSGFGSSQGDSTVTFNGTTATPSSWTGTSIIVPVPNGATSGNVSVGVGGENSNEVSFSISPDSSNYGYEKSIVISHAQVPNTDQVNFPLLVSGTYSYLADSANGGGVQSALGYDIVFTSDAAGSSVLPFEQEGYSPATGTVVYWIQVPTVSSTADTTIYMFYGNSSVTADQSNPTAVWDSNYIGVWHLPNGTTLSANDSTSNGNNGDISGATATVGEIGGGAAFDGSSVITIPSNGSLTGSFTIEEWADPGTTSGSLGLFGSRSPSDHGFDAKLDGSGVHGDIGDGSSWLATGADGSFSYSANTWHHVAYTVSDTGYQIFADGVQVGSGSFSGTPLLFDSTHELEIGGTGYSGEDFIGAIDEVRVSSSLRSADWIATEFNNQSSPSTFFSIGGVGSGGGPSITSLSVTSGAVGASVTITGSNFGSTQGTSTVTFNGTVASVTSWGATSIVVTVPTGATTGNLVVNVSGASSNGMSFTVAATPSITSLSPTSGVVAVSVTITGSNFGSTQGTSTVTFNGTTASVTSWGATSIVVTVPTGATTGNVVVNASGVSSNGVTFTVVSAPSITNVSPTSGAVGASVTITGSNFGSSQGASTVTFNGMQASPTNWSASSITVTVPTAATTGNIVVTVGGGSSNAIGFTVLPQPTITSLSATSATVGVSITVTGANFGSTQGTSTVTFNGVAGTPTNWSSTSIVVPVPVGATTGNVIVNASGVSSNPVSLTVTLLSLPTVSQVQPTNGATGVPENGRVIVRFAQPVQSAAVIIGTITLFQGGTNVAGTFALSNDGLSVTFTPTANLAASSTFTVSVTDVTGNQSSPQFQSTFATGSTTDTVTPAVLQTSPQNYNTNIPISAPIVVQFTKAMDPATMTPQSFLVNDSVTGPVAGVIQVDPTGTIVSFVPQTYFAVGSTVSVGLATNLIKDSSGNTIAGTNSSFNFTTSFTADTTAPQLLGMSPTDGTTGVPQNALIVLEFSKPLNVISVSNGFQVLAGDQAIPGGIALSNSDEQVTFTPPGGLLANTTYTVVTTSQITDVGGLALANPGSFSLTTGNTSDSTVPTVVSMSPTNLETEVPTNAVVQLQFSKPIDPWTVTTSSFLITYGTSGILQGSVSVSSDGLTATFTPSGALQPFTPYYVGLSGGITDLEGHPLSGGGGTFTTGSTTETSAPSVVTVSPANGLTGVPINPRIDLVMSATVDAASVGSNTVILSVSGVAVPGTATVGGTGTIVTFVPSNSLMPSTAYTLTVSGLTDQAGNTITPFTSSFTTGTSGTINTTTPAVVSVNPANGVGAISVNTSIGLTFNEPIDLTTVSDTSLPVSANGVVVAGSYTLDSTSTVVTFAPLSPLPGNATVAVQVTESVTDLSGDGSDGFSSSFTTGSGTDTTAPVVAMITPSAGATNMGTNAVAVLTFSKSLNPSTINTNNFAMLVNGSVIPISINTSADNRVVTLNPYGLALSSTVTVLVTSAVTDLSGNALAGFQSQFTTVASTSGPSVATQRPGNGATGVPLNSSVVLYMSEPMNVSSLQSALQVSQNGNAVSGTIQVTDNGQVIQFTPTSQWSNSASIQVFLTSAAQSVSGLSLGNYQASFTTVSNLSTAAPSIIATNPITQITGVPTNAIIDFEFSQPIDPTALLPDSVTCFQNGIWLQTGVSVVDGGLLLQITPRVPLAPNTSTNCILGNGVQGTNGLALSSLSSNAVSFTTGAGTDTVIPTILSTSPPNGSSNVGDNAQLNLDFSKSINPLTVNSNTIQLSGGGSTYTADSISFSNGNQTAVIVPHAALPDNTSMTLTVSGVTDLAGNIEAAQTTQFTTGAGPDVVPPKIVSANPSNGAQSVPINTIVLLQMSEPIDPVTVNGSTLTLENVSTGQNVSGSYSVSANGLTITFVPSAPLSANTGYSLSFPGAGFGFGISDLAGNSLQGTSAINFSTGTTASTSAPQVLAVSPSNRATAIPINAQVVIQFNEPVNAVMLSGVTISGVSNLSQTLTNGNQTLTLIPNIPLSPNTSYTLTVSGVQDLSGNTMASPYTATFSTGSNPDVTQGTVVSETPANNATGIATNASITVTFSKSMDPLTVSTSTMLLTATTDGIPVAGTVSSSGSTATFTPTEPLDSLTQYVVSLTSGVIDLEGQNLLGGSFSYYFTTGDGTASPGPTIITIPGGAGGAVGSICTIEGTYFGTSQGTSTVTFNGTSATITNWSDTTIQATVPSGATSGPVLVTVNSVASNPAEFTVVGTATVLTISPTSGAAGTPVTITGTSLGDGNDYDLAYFGGVTSAPTAVSETSITVPVPASAPPGNASVTVSVNGYASAQSLNFTVIATPAISQVNPNSGVTGTPVSIYGNYFGTSQGASTVTFNGIPAASITSWGNTGITAVPPNNVTTGPVVVTVDSIASNSNYSFTVANPSIGSVVPPAAAPGSVVTIYGSNFEPQGSQTFQVLFNGVPSPSVACTTYYCSSENPPYSSLTAEVPNGASTGPITVLIGTITSNGVDFTVEAQPTITSISPAIGPMSAEGTVVPVTITGTGFGAAPSTSAVNFFGSSTQPTITSWSDTSITLSVPSDASTGPVSIQVGSLSALSPTNFTVNSVTQLTDSLGNQTQYDVASVGGTWFPSSSQGPGCVTCTMRGNITNTPDGFGNVLATTDDMGNTTSYTYDPTNDLASSSKPLNSTTTATTSYTYNSLGEVLTMTDPLGNVTTNTYDANGNLLTVTSPAPSGNISSSVTQFQYATNGELTQITDPKGNVTKLTYTSVGLIASITDAQNNVTSYEYDSKGDRTAVIDPINGSAHPTSFTYDAMSRLLGITYPDGSSVSFTYDIRGRRITSTDQNGKTTTYSYDNADRLTTVTDPANNSTQYAYDTEDNLLSITDANGHATQFAYNARGWVMQTTFPSTLAESYTYDLVGNLLSKTDRKGNTIQYVYDALYRLSSKTYPDSTAVDYAYDLANKVLQVSDPTGTYGFAYDNMGRLISTTTQYAFVAGTYTNSYSYDAASNRTSLTAPDGSVTTYAYDTDNRLNTLANTWAGSFGFAYDALSRRTQLTRPNGIATNYSYDSVSHLLSVLHQAGVNTLDGATYTYDAFGNRTSKTNYLNSITSNYTYDPLYELTQVTQGASTTESYSYDSVGNRLSSLDVANYNYNVSNELTSDSNGSFTYDNNGNTLTEASGNSYSWDFENRLVQAVVPGTSGGTTTFKYDPFGRRIYKQSPSFTSNFVYDGSNLIETLNSSGSEVASYAQTRTIDEPLAELRGSTTDYYDADGVGSITSLSGSSGTLANTYTYDSFGNQTASTGTVRNYLQYTGREFDPETGIYEYRARYYAPQIGRFISEDPLGFGSGDGDFYGYVLESPTNLTDPLGLCGCSKPAPGPTDPFKMLDRNIHEAMETSASEPLSFSLPFFYWNSRTGGAWDPKDLFWDNHTYEAFGDYQWGAICNAYGYSQWQCQAGAGLYQRWGDFRDAWHEKKLPTFSGQGHWPFSPPYWDKVPDSDFIRRGWDYAEWKRNCATQ